MKRGLLSGILILGLGATGALRGVEARGEAPGPVGIAMKSDGTGVILQSDGRVVAFEPTRRSFRELYRTPATFQATDIALGYASGPDFCMVVNGKTEGAGNYLLQILPGNIEVWTYLAQTGLFVGVATDPERKVGYVTEPLANTVYSVALGMEKAPVKEVVTLPLADRIGPIAIDAAGQRLFVADMDGSDVFIISLATREVQRIALQKMSDIRGLAWSPAPERLYIADAGKGAVWVSDGTGRAPASRTFKGGGLKTPSGLSWGPDGVLWAVDEKARAAIPLNVRQGTVLASIDVRVPSRK